MYGALQTEIAEFLELEEDLFALPIVVDSPPSTEKTVQEQLNEKGACLIIGKPRQQRTSATEVRVEVPLVYLVNEQINTSENGVNMSAEILEANLMVCLDGHQTQPFWTPFNCRPFSAKDPEFALHAVGIMLETKTLVVRDFAILCTHTGAAICDHDDAAILTTNRGKQY